MLLTNYILPSLVVKEYCLSPAYGAVDDQEGAHTGQNEEKLAHRRRLLSASSTSPRKYARRKNTFKKCLKITLN